LVVVAVDFLAGDFGGCGRCFGDFGQHPLVVNLGATITGADVDVLEEQEEPDEEDFLVSAELDELTDDFPLSLLLVAPAVFGDLERVLKNLAIFLDLLLLYFLS